MPRLARTALSALGIALLAAGALTGCATAIDAGGSNPAPSGSAGSGENAEIEVEAAWLDGGRVVGVITYGSSTCLPSVTSADVQDGVLSVELFDDAEAACTRDMVPRVTPVELSGDVDPSQGLEIRVTGEGYYGDTDLDGVDGLTPAAETDYLPSAGWADDDGQFVILSWGSSTCVPVVEDVTASAPDVTVTFATPPADQACTMDMVPRGVIAQVDGLEDDDDVFAILQGGEFDNVRIPIIG